MSKKNEAPTLQSIDKKLDNISSEIKNLDIPHKSDRDGISLFFKIAKYLMATVLAFNAVLLPLGSIPIENNFLFSISSGISIFGMLAVNVVKSLDDKSSSYKLWWIIIFVMLVLSVLFCFLGIVINPYAPLSNNVYMPGIPNYNYAPFK